MIKHLLRFPSIFKEISNVVVSIIQISREIIEIIADRQQQPPYKAQSTMPVQQNILLN